MIRLFVSLYVALFSTLASAQTPVTRIGVTVQGRPLTLVPETGQLLNADGARLRQSLIWSDSKAQAFHLSPSLVVKFYTGPQPFLLESTDLAAQAAKSEAALINQWSAIGAALPVVETGQTQEGVFYAVMEKPKRGVSASHLVKKGRVAEVQDKLQKLASGLSDNLWKLGSLNPTQVYVERRGERRALLIKSYQGDQKIAPEAQPSLGSHYEGKLAQFKDLAEMVPGYRAGTQVSRGGKTTDKSQVARMVLDALRTDSQMRVVYQGNSGPPKMFHIQPQKGRLWQTDFLKGYMKATVFPESGPSKEYTFKLDRIQEAEFLREQPAAAITDRELSIVAMAVALDKGTKRYTATRRKAKEYLKKRQATETQLKSFEEALLASAPPHPREIGARGALTDQAVIQAAQSAASSKGYPWSQTEYDAGRYPAAWGLWENGASFDQMILFFKTTDEAPIRGGRFNSYSGD